MLVLDRSATLAWLFEDERTPALEALLNRVGDIGAVVPSVWCLEVANVLQIAVRRGRIDQVFQDACLKDLRLLPVSTDPETHLHAWDETLSLAARHRLTPYDASYLELAKRRGLELATLDRNLRRAAEIAGVALARETAQ